MAALRDHIVETKWKGTDDSPTATRIEAYFLKNVQQEGNRRHKLVLRRHDQETLRAILDSTELPPNPSERIRENYEYFCEQIASADPDDIYRGLDRLIVVDVTLDRDTDDPQLIFANLAYRIDEQKPLEDLRVGLARQRDAYSLAVPASLEG